MSHLSTRIKNCQVCGHNDFKEVLFLGYLPPVNALTEASQAIDTQPFFPAELVSCRKCHLVQLSQMVNPEILFPKTYPYTSSTTKILRDNFQNLSDQIHRRFQIKADDFIVDIGSNDGNLLSFFKDRCRVLGITPEDIGQRAVERGIPTHFGYFSEQAVPGIVKKYGRARFVSATNVFAHMEDVPGVMRGIDLMLEERGVFVSESHYWKAVVETLQYDTIYHEHLRYYSLKSLAFLLRQHGFEAFDVELIPTHGGSIRVYAARKGDYAVSANVLSILQSEEDFGLFDDGKVAEWTRKVYRSRVEIASVLNSIRLNGDRIFAVGAPSRGSTLISFTGLDHTVIEAVAEKSGSHKIGKFMPGTKIPVVDERQLFDSQPEYALLLSWHIADELIPALREKGYSGNFIVPLPEVRILRGASQ